VNGWLVGVIMSKRPTWSLPYFQENYTGPYLSDGKIQPSVAFGKTEPRSELDAISRDHDTSYALFNDRANRRFADYVYWQRSRKLPGFFPKLAGAIVYYGNSFADAVSDTLSGESNMEEDGVNMALWGGPSLTDRFISALTPGGNFGDPVSDVLSLIPKNTNSEHEDGIGAEPRQAPTQSRFRPVVDAYTPEGFVSIPQDQAFVPQAVLTNGLTMPGGVVDNTKFRNGPQAGPRDYGVVDNTKFRNGPQAGPRNYTPIGFVDPDQPIDGGVPTYNHVSTHQSMARRFLSRFRRKKKKRVYISN